MRKKDDDAIKAQIIELKRFLVKSAQVAPSRLSGRYEERLATLPKNITREPGDPDSLWGDDDGRERPFDPDDDYSDCA
jgi:hypothetical protein